jgi:hypothetical protein
MSAPCESDPAEADVQTRSIIAGAETLESCSRTGWKRIEKVEF